MNTSSAWRILLIDDDRDDYFIVRELLAAARQGSFSLDWACTYQKGCDSLQTDSYDAVLVDYDLGAQKGIDLIREFTQAGYPAPMILLTGRGSYDIDVQAMHSGAADYLSKQDINARYLERSLRYAIEKKRNERALNEINFHLEQANRELALKNQQLFGVFANAPAGLVLFEAGEPFRVVQTNQIYQSFFPEPYRSQGMVGLGLQDYVPTAEYDGILVIFKEVAETGQGKTIYDFPFTGMPEGTTWWNWHLNPIISEGKITGLVHMAVNITEQHRAKQALEESELRFRGTFENAAVGIAHVSLDGRFFLVNQRFCEITGYSTQELSNLTFQAITFPEDLTADLALVEQLRRREIDHYMLEKRYIRKDGSLVWANLTVSTRVDDHGNIEYGIAVIEDITLRKAVERDLQEREATLRAFFETDTVYAGIVELGAKDLVYSLVNPKLAEFFGCSPDEVVGKTGRELGFSDEILAEWLPIYQHSLETGRSVHLEYSLPVAGKQNWYYGSISPIVSETTQRPSFVFVAVDISLRKRAEMEMRKHQDRLQQILNTTYDGIWTLDEFGRTDYINERGAEILGYTVAEMLGSSPANFLFPEDQAIVPQGLAERRQGKGDLQEYRMRHKSGEEVWIFSSTTPIYGPENQYVGAMAMFTDITVRKKAEQALRESEQRFRIALSAVPMFVFTIDQQHRFTWVHNPPLECTAEALLGQPDERLFLGDLSQQLTVLKQTVFESRRGISQEIQGYIGPEWKSYFATFEPILDEQQEIRGLIGAMLDMTEVRQLEKQQVEYKTQVEVQRRLMNQREMERMEIARDLHDGVLQELTAMGFGLMEALRVDQKEERLSRLLDIREELKQIATDIRAFCSDLRPPALAPFGLEKAIRSHVEEFQKRHPHIDIALNLEPDQQTLSQEVRIALFRVYQEIMNNISKHSQASNVWITWNIDETGAFLEIEDNGVGFQVPEDWMVQARIGHLGLLGMRERVEAIHATIDFESSPGRGSVIRVKCRLNQP